MRKLKVIMSIPAAARTESSVKDSSTSASLSLLTPPIPAPAPVEARTLYLSPMCVLFFPCVSAYVGRLFLAYSILTNHFCYSFC